MKMLPNQRCWCGSQIKYKKCHMKYDSKIKEMKREGYIVPSRNIIKNQVQIEGIRESGKINTAILDYISSRLQIGMTTEEIDVLVKGKTEEFGGIPATLGYHGYTKSVCTSINNQVCHGIPSSQVLLQDGDIINIDVSTIYNNYYADSSRMFLIGKVSNEKKKLVRVAQECIEYGLAQIKPWACFGNMSAAIDKHAKSYGFSVVKEIGGHGVGLEFHEDPWIGYTEDFGRKMLMTPGMIFTIEPMINMGTAEVKQDETDGWTIYTVDDKPSAQWEIMVLVTDTGYEVLAK